MRTRLSWFSTGHSAGLAPDRRARSALGSDGASAGAIRAVAHGRDAVQRFALDRLLRALVRRGSLEVRWPYGPPTLYRGMAGGSSVGISLRDFRAVRRLLFDPGLGLGEAYMDGSLVVNEGDIYGVIAFLLDNLDGGGRHPLFEYRMKTANVAKRWLKTNGPDRSRRNVAHHYDLDSRLYAMFLDQDRQYSCAYYRQGNESLEDAQTAKKLHIASKLNLDRPGLSILDVGCGWGGMALTLASTFGARVHGITLSVEQLAVARKRAEAEGLSGLVTFGLQDYRALDEKFDRIVSVGMFEHVGLANYRAYFDMIKRCLEPQGIALVHSIGRADGPGATNRWLQKYIFPGGYSPALSEVIPHIEASGLWVTDVEILRLHYARTIQAWRDRFEARRGSIARLHDARFCRMFEFYLAGCQAAFTHDKHMNFQIQLAPLTDTVPLTRDYMFLQERELTSGDQPEWQPARTSRASGPVD